MELTKHSAGFLARSVSVARISNRGPEVFFVRPGRTAWIGIEFIFGDKFMQSFAFLHPLQLLAEISSLMVLRHKTFAPKQLRREILQSNFPDRRLQLDHP